jgi:hypothetical protein
MLSRYSVKKNSVLLFKQKKKKLKTIFFNLNINNSEFLIFIINNSEMGQHQRNTKSIILVTVFELLTL